MHFFSNLYLSLKTKLIVTSVIVELILLTILIWNDTILTQNQLISQKQREIDDISMFILDTVTSSLSNNDIEDLHNLLKHVDKSSKINYISIQSLDGLPMAETGVYTEPGPSNEALLTHFLHSGYTDTYRIMLPIEKQNTAMGNLDLEFNISDIGKASATILRRSIVNAFLIVISTIILLYALLSALTKNLKNLTAAVTKYIHTKTTDIPATNTNDEVGKLAQTFSQLISSLQYGEESLAEREQTLQAILDNSPAVIYAKDRQGRYLLANKKIAEFLGKGIDEILGKTDFEIFPKNIAEQLQKNDQEILASHSVKQIVEIVPRNAENRNYLSAKFCLFDKNQQAYAVCGISTDITDRIHDEKRLRESEENLRSLANSAFDGIVVNKKGKHVFTNQRMADLMGTTVEEIIGTEIEFVVHPSELNKVRQRFQRRLQGSAEPMQYETKLNHRKIAEGVPVEITAFISQWEGEPSGVLFVRDIRERKKIEAELTRYQLQLETLVSERTAELETAIQEIESFSYSVSHDLRSPLRSIDGFSLLLLEDYNAALDDKGKDYLTRVRKAAQNMAQLIDDILMLSRVSRHKLTISDINLSDLATESFTTLREHQPQHEVNTIIEPGIVSKGDKRLVKIVLDNLFSNAWKYTGTRAKPEIKFGSVQKNNKTVYYVKDNGVGFDTKYAEKMFGAFQRLHTADEFPGTGIGLATVNRIIRHHNGEIWAESKLGEGATFYFTLS